MHNPDSFSTTSCRICVDPMRLRGLHNAPGQCQCPAPLQREAPGGGQNTSGRPAIQAPSVKTPRPQTLQQPCTHARGSAAGTRTGRAILDGPRMSITTASARRVCASPTPVRGRTTRTYPGGRTTRTHRAEAGTRTCMSVLPRRLRPAALRARVWNHGTSAPGGREHDTPRKSSAPAGSRRP